MVLYQNSVIENGERALLYDASTRIASRRVEDYVVRLPLLRWSAGVHQWRVLAVQSACGPVGVSRILVGIENLDLVQSLEEDSAVTPQLAMLIRHIRDRELDVDLGVAELLFAENVAGSRLASHSPVLDQTFRRSAVLHRPVREILAVEEHHGIGWRFAGASRINDTWLGSVAMLLGEGSCGQGEKRRRDPVSHVFIMIRDGLLDPYRN